MNHFDQKLLESNYNLRKSRLEILQVNVGKLCNLTCVHCHVEAGPTKTRENMGPATAEAVVRLMDHETFTTFDITGGAPEMSPHFRYLVQEARKRNLKVIDRCNLTIFYEPGMDALPQFLADNQVEVVASMPCYMKDNVDKQRGRGTFDRSIEALGWLNRLGYGKENSGLILNLVYNPVGSHLPPAQGKLEADYKKQLRENFGIEFNRLFTITNMPITRYAKYLKAFNQLDSYVELLINSFNASTLDGLMCRNTLSVGWDGKIYDCDFNQMLNMPIRLASSFDRLRTWPERANASRRPLLAQGKSLTIFDLNIDTLENFEILTGNHCFGCTAGSGSSCQGALQN